MSSLFKTTSQKLTDALWERLKYAEGKNENSVNWDTKATQIKIKTQHLFNKYLASEKNNTSAKSLLKTEYYMNIMNLFDLLEQKKYNEIVSLRQKLSKLYKTNLNFKRKNELRNLLTSIVRIAAFSPERTVPLTSMSENTDSISTEPILESSSIPIPPSIENWGVSKKRKNTRKVRKARKNQTRKY